MSLYIYIEINYFESLLIIETKGINSVCQTVDQQLSLMIAFNRI